MELVVAWVAAAGAVASEVSTRTFLEAARQSAKDRAANTETAAAMAATEQDSLASRLAVAEAQIEKLRTAAASAEEAAERAKTNATATETTARDAAQAAAREKALLEASVRAGGRSEHNHNGFGNDKPPVFPSYKPTPGGN
jgi:chromosome segregation ATPase